jgi:cytochrome c oxidase subunit 2
MMMARVLISSITSFAPQAPGTHAIVGLWEISLVVFTLIFAFVVCMIVYSLMRFRWREGEPDPDQIAGNSKVELIWTVIPFLIVIILCALTVRTMGLADPPAAPEPDLIVTGHQWWWEAQYVKTGVITANEIHIPVGKALSVRLDASDVLHEFWVPELARKMTTVPGHPNHIWVQADKAGTYNGVCSEFCGTEHAWMRFLVVAEPPEQFAEWEKAQLAPAAQPTGDAAKGLALFEQMSCVSCHAIKGTPANAHVAPDLTHFASRRQLGAGIDPNTPQTLREWLQDPQHVKPGVLMPNFKFTEEQINDLVAYFETLK